MLRKEIRLKSMDLVVTEVAFCQTVKSFCGLRLVFAEGVVFESPASATPANVAVAKVIRFPFRGNDTETVASAVMSEAAVIPSPTVSPLVPSMSAPAITVLELFAATVKIPLDALKVMIPEATVAESVKRFSPSNRYTFVRDASADTPNLFNLRFVTFTTLLVPFEKTNFAKGANPCPSTTVDAAGVSEANETVNAPVVTGGGGGGVPGVGVGVGVGAGAAPSIALSFARIEAPTNPVPADNPTGVRISAAYLF